MCRPASVRATVLVSLVLVLAALVAGCGSTHPARSSSSAAARPSSLPEGPASGREVFARDCAFCHSLTGHNNPKQQGGDLLGAHLHRPVLVQFTAEMPAKRPLSRAEIAAVVDYVLAVQRRGGQG